MVVAAFSSLCCEKMEGKKHGSYGHGGADLAFVMISNLTFISMWTRAD